MLGDGIRRNIASVTKEERDRFRDAIIKLHTLPQFQYPGNRGQTPAGGVSYWFKQDEIHAGSHVHVCPAFLPWHRELINRFEALLRLADPQLSLYYWDWTTDPGWMFTGDFMGNGDPTVNPTVPPETAGGQAGDPWLTAGLYNPTANPFRTDNEFSTTDNPFDPPHDIARSVQAGAPVTAAQEQLLLSATSFAEFDTIMERSTTNDQINNFDGGLHGAAHGWIGGLLGNQHTSFRDPFVYLLHSNVDRLFAMWQRQAGQFTRLDPAHVYDFTAGEWLDPATSSAKDPELGSGSVTSGEPWWGFKSPMEPWAGGLDADTTSTGQITGLRQVRPWAAPENQQLLKDSRDPSIVIPPSYDTAVHSSYIIVNRDTFSNSEVQVISGVSAFPYGPATFASAFYVVYDGFEPKELGVTTTPLPALPSNLPTFVFTGANHISAVNPSASYEDPSGAIDVPQRITITYDLKFADGGDFPMSSGGEVPVNMQTKLTYNVDTGTGGTTVSVSEVANTELLLVNQPNPYMIDTQQGDPSPYWLSVDTRVFQVKKGDIRGAGPAGPNGPATQGDLDTDPNAAFGFIQQVVRNFNSLLNDNSHPFLSQLSEDETASQLELSQKVGGQRVYNYAVAKVRYQARATVDAISASAFFRVFSTAVSALDYDATSGTTGNYRRNGNVNGSSVPLLGIENDSQGQPETASIPFFASARVAQTVSMTNQLPDTTNVQTITGTGSENVAYFGVWLDMNLAPGDPNFRQFPLNPLADPGGPDGPYTGPVQSIQQLMLGTHHCMVAEIFFWPGISSDPIPHDASPASSDRLAQRNLVLVKSGNPGYPATHTVQHTFLVKPSISSVDQPVAAEFRSSQAKRGKRLTRAQAAAAVVEKGLRGPDELLIRWNNLPRKTEAMFYLPEIEVDEILALSALRQHPTVLKKVDAHTLRCQLADITYIPLPSRKGTIAGLMSLILPPGVRTGQVYKLSVEQYSGYTHKTLGAFQMSIPVRPDPEILPEEIRKLSVMRYIQQAIPAGSRWVSIFTRYLDQIAARVRGFGGDPDAVKPSPDGGEGGEVCPPPSRPEVCPPDLFCLNIPWRECDIEGELDLKVRFRRKCK
jgi:hypothetical protein